MPRQYYVYILASRRKGTLYTGLSNSLLHRIPQHRGGMEKGFTNKYGVHRLVWYRALGDIRETIAMEKRIKRWRRQWKIELIEESNPEWRDLHPQLLDEMGPGPEDEGSDTDHVQ